MSIEYVQLNTNGTVLVARHRESFYTQPRPEDFLVEFTTRIGTRITTRLLYKCRLAGGGVPPFLLGESPIEGLCHEIGLKTVRLATETGDIAPHNLNPADDVTLRVCYVDQACMANWYEFPCPLFRRVASGWHYVPM